MWDAAIYGNAAKRLLGDAALSLSVEQWQGAEALQERYLRYQRRSKSASAVACTLLHPGETLASICEYAGESYYREVWRCAFKWIVEDTH